LHNLEPLLLALEVMHRVERELDLEDTRLEIEEGSPCA
jgi:hypothetical protein